MKQANKGAENSHASYVAALLFRKITDAHHQKIQVQNSEAFLCDLTALLSQSPAMGTIQEQHCETLASQLYDQHFKSTTTLKKPRLIGAPYLQVTIPEPAVLFAHLEQFSIAHQCMTEHPAPTSHQSTRTHTSSIRQEVAHAMEKPMAMPPTQIAMEHPSSDRPQPSALAVLYAAALNNPPSSPSTLSETTSTGPSDKGTHSDESWVMVSPTHSPRWQQQEAERAQQRQAPQTGRSSAL